MNRKKKKAIKKSQKSRAARAKHGNLTRQELLENAMRMRPDRI